METALESQTMKTLEYIHMGLSRTGKPLGLSRWIIWEKHQLHKPANPGSIPRNLVKKRHAVVFICNPGMPTERQETGELSRNLGAH